MNGSKKFRSQSLDERLVKALERIAVGQDKEVKLCSKVLSTNHQVLNEQREQFKHTREVDSKLLGFREQESKVFQMHQRATDAFMQLPQHINERCAGMAIDDAVKMLVIVVRELTALPKLERGQMRDGEGWRSSEHSITFSGLRPNTRYKLFECDDFARPLPADMTNPISVITAEQPRPVSKEATDVMEVLREAIPQADGFSEGKAAQSIDTQTQDLPRVMVSIDGRMLQLRCNRPRSRVITPSELRSLLELPDSRRLIWLRFFERGTTAEKKVEQDVEMLGGMELTGGEQFFTQ